MDTSTLGLGGGISLWAALPLLFWIIASFLIPFLIWGIYNQTHKGRQELEKMRKLMELQTVHLRKAGGQPIPAGASETETKVGRLD